MRIAPILIIIAAALWALDGLLRRSLYGLPAPTLIFFEHVLGFILISLFAYHSLRKAVFTKKEVLTLLAVSLLSGVIGTLFFTKALAEVGFIAFSVAILIQKLQPIFAIGVARIIGHEKIHPKSYLFIVIALIAGYYVTFPGGVSLSPDGQKELLAASYALIAAAAWGSSTNFSKYLLNNHHPEVVTMLRFGITALIIGAGLLIIPEWRGGFRTPTGSEFGYLFMIACSTGLVAMYIYYRGLKHTPVHVSAILELTWPIIAVLVDYLVYDTILSTGQYVAMVTLIASMYAVTHLGQKKMMKSIAETEKSL